MRCPLRARPEDHARAAGAEAGPSARQVAGDRGSTAAGCIAETGAIVEYLVEKAEGRLGPPANRDARPALPPVPPLCRRLDDAALAGPAGRQPRSACSARPAKKPLLAMFRQSSRLCSKASWPARAWFAGDEFTAADVMMSFPLEAAAPARRARPVASEHARLAGAHPRPPGLCRGAEAGRALRLRLRRRSGRPRLELIPRIRRMMTGGGRRR